MQSVLLHRYLAVITVTTPKEDKVSTSSEITTRTSDSATNGVSNVTGSTTSSSSRKEKLNGSSSNSNGSAKDPTTTSAVANGSAANAGGTSAGRFRLETNFYVLATACILLANKSLRARVGSARPRRREELLRAAYGVQFRGRTVEKGTAEALKWEGKLAAAELEVLLALGFDLHLTDPLEALDHQLGEKVSLAWFCLVVSSVCAVVGGRGEERS